ncbi:MULTISPECIES: GNAT family N-acetyltransferase [unclassified Pseudomonas]|uniref:GNAT family N-acetyltransferase n=1 Tax=unclassified Pseudomonas TaxID=196821 RepID=UPI0024483116|nr:MULTISPECIES: GNAT family N-acetyltransferase [unclassified Pseudomonas]MDH0305304.1 GNAT family N-acetyltransferase [Pseudomonas sp. GD04091]MDH1987989.1 GNAT family N-acetyltransferase [Pseudomonas sp. GD03689]
MTTTQLPVFIREAKQADLQPWRDHWAQYQAFYQVDLGPAITERTWARFFDPAEPMHCAVATDGEQIFGFVHYVFHRSTWGRNDFCYLEDLFVCPSARGRTVGKRLIEYVQDQARQQQCDRLYWHTQETNRTAQRLYDWIAEKPGVIEYRMPLDVAH